jgi:hypothetical protein
MEHAANGMFGPLDVGRLSGKAKGVAVGVHAHFQPVFKSG